MKVSIRTISVEWNGEIKGLDFVMCCAAQYCSADLGFNEADRLSEDLDRLTRQLMELAWICRRFAESGVYFGYILDVSIARSGISVMRFRKMEEGPTPLPRTPSVQAQPGISNAFIADPTILFAWIARMRQLGSCARMCLREPRTSLSLRR